jgi:lysozyme
MLPTYNPKEPPHIQETDADCAVESIEWCLYSWGRTPDDDWLEQSMQAAGVWSPAVGLHDATGAGLAVWLNDEYGEFGYIATNEPSVGFDDVAAEAGTRRHPLAIGGRAWYHWSAVAGYDAATDLLRLRNSAPGYKGVYQTLNRSQWASLGAWSMVRLTHPEAEAAAAPAAGVGGPDVASWQGDVDWAAVAASGASFGFTKATGGAWYTNPTLAANWAGMRAAGLARGAYHYAFESSGDPLPGLGPEAEADWFLSQVEPLGLEPGDMLVLDIEEGQGDLGAWALAWLRHVEGRVGFKPLLYTGAWFADPHGFANHPDLAGYPLWIAAYQGTPPPAIAPWTGYAFWQYTSQAIVPGVVGPCDMSAFGGSREDLALYGKPGSGDPAPPEYAGIGSGLLQMMSDDNTYPAQRVSTWLPLGVSPSDVEECLGANGVMYRWLLTIGAGHRYPPS